MRADRGERIAPTHWQSYQQRTATTIGKNRQMMHPLTDAAHQHLKLEWLAADVMEYEFNRVTVEAVTVRHQCHGSSITSDLGSFESCLESAFSAIGQAWTSVMFNESSAWPLAPKFQLRSVLQSFGSQRLQTSMYT
eukprot:617214-Amphidinium_carterae.1